MAETALERPGPRPGAGAPKASWFHRHRRAIAPWLFLAPGVLFFLVYVIFPIFQSFEISLYKWDGLGEARYIGLRNYERLFTDRAFETSLWNNLKWLILYLLAVPAGLLIAIFLNQTVTGIRLYKSLFFFPFVISQVVVGSSSPGSTTRHSGCSTQSSGGSGPGRSTFSGTPPSSPTELSSPASGRRPPTA